MEDRFAQARRGQVRDLGRFLGDGTRSLDELLRETASSPEALQAIAKERVQRLRESRTAEQRRIAEQRRT